MTIFFSLFFFINQPFAEGVKINKIILILSDSFLPAGIVTLAIPAFILIGRTGMFDIVVFGLIAFGESFKKDITHKYESPYQYKEVQDRKRHERKPYLIPYLILGGTALVLSLIFTIIFMCM